MTRSLWLALVILAGMAAGADADDKGLFRRRVAPILQRRCAGCHRGDVAKGDLSLVTGKAALAGGESGPAIAPGMPEESLLLQYVSGDDPEMPKDGPPLTAEEISAIRDWIAAGAAWPVGVTLTDRWQADRRWWSLQPLLRPDIPPLESVWIRTPIDAFILGRLNEHGLTPSAEADRCTLVRRLYFDLIGLPPAPGEIDRFVEDDDPRAYDKLVDRLLDSSHYGERWARHWLDVVHYADTHGYDKDKLRPNAWPYRDYVIRAFSEDKPYGRFVEEQLAGDVLYPSTTDGIAALGFIAAGPWDYVGHAEVPEDKIDGQIARHLDRDDMVTTTMNALVSMTAQCARCHDHKFDPVTQEDYYSLQAVFAAIDRADRPYDADPDVARRRADLQERAQRLTGEKKALLAEAAGRGMAPSDLGEPTKRKLTDLENALSEASAQLIALPEQSLVFVGTVHHGTGNFRGTGHTSGRPRVIHLLDRGNILNPSKVVAPGAVPIYEASSARFDLPENHREGARRAALAQWIVDRRNPLTWRSIVNRIWQYHFGRAIVDSPNDFGRMGRLPTHPNLLDWLAVEFRDGGRWVSRRQSFKALHRLIVTSAVYRQSSADNAGFSKLDGGNQYLWRMNRRRLEAESIWDATLAVSGKLDHKMFGPGFWAFIVEKPEHSPHFQYHKHDPDDVRSHRRAIYRFIVRSAPDPFMQVLDCADPSQLVDKRNETLTALQALAMMNNKFMVRMSEHLADRVAKAGDDLPARIESVYRLVLGRSPTADERDELVAYGRQFGLANTCRLVLNLNEFAFVD